MTDLDVILSKLTTIEETQKTQGGDIKELTRGFSVLATQNEQIMNLQNQVSTLWRKYDSMTGPDSTLERVREHQKGCPKDEMHRTFAWLWKVISVHSAILTGLCGWIFYFMVTR